MQKLVLITFKKNEYFINQKQKNDGNGERRSPFDNLDRDELIKKCKGLLGIAQKAKKAKDGEFIEHNIY